MRTAGKATVCVTTVVGAPWLGLLASREVAKQSSECMQRLVGHLVGLAGG